MAWGWVEYISNAAETGWNATVDGVTYMGEKAYNGVKHVGGKAVDGIAYVGGKAIDFADTAVQYSGKFIQKGTDLVSDSMVHSAKVIDKKLNDSGEWLGEKAYEYFGDKVPPIHINKQDIPFAVEGFVKNPFSSYAQIVGGITEASGDILNQVTTDGLLSIPKNSINTAYDLAINNTVVNLVSSHINGPEKLETQTNVKEIKDPIFIAYYPAGQEKVGQGHAAMWYRGLKVDVAPFFDNPHSFMSGDMIYGEKCEKPMFDTSSGKDVCYIYMIDPKNIGMATEKDCQRVFNRMKKGIENTRGKGDDVSAKLSKDYYHGLTNNCVSSVLKSLAGYIPDAGIDSPYTLSNTLSELVDNGKAQRLSVDRFNQHVENKWKEKEKEIQQTPIVQTEETPQPKDEPSTINPELWKKAFLDDAALNDFFDKNPDLEIEFIKSRKLAPFSTPAQNMKYKREFLLRKNPEILKIMETKDRDIESLFKNNSDLEKEYRYWTKSSPSQSSQDVINLKKYFLIEKKVKEEYSGDIKDINLDFLSYNIKLNEDETITTSENVKTNASTKLNQVATKIDNNAIHIPSSNKIKNNEEEIQISALNNNIHIK